jgi:membrane associated rhomboid family serine protease
MVLVLIAANVVVSMFAFQASGEDRERFVFIPNRFARGDNVQGMLLSHLSHADMNHLLVNMLALYMFGPILERGLGASSLLIVYLASGAIATAATFVLRKSDPRFRSLGASGSTAGVLFAAIVLRPQMRLSLLFLPVLVPAPLFAILYVVLSSYFMGRKGARVCHEAHVGGALAGLVIGALLSPHGFAPLLERIRQMLS